MWLCHKECVLAVVLFSVLVTFVSHLCIKYSDLHVFMNLVFSLYRQTSVFVLLVLLFVYVLQHCALWLHSDTHQCCLICTAIEADFSFHVVIFTEFTFRFPKKLLGTLSFLFVPENNILIFMLCEQLTSTDWATFLMMKGGVWKILLVLEAPVKK